ncbi:uncharacterized protein LOC125189661 [Salvia hispanica]|uniref:uncharacterized protein LOC125189661 n=1 Tax=Salvia hispanica TaxID=49212 RepID=UPI002008F1CC|nr:uncharacterized protein LOC125189661 [Salvia hispanica]
MDDHLEETQLDKAMPWIGAYIAAASAVCTVAMAADAFNGFRLKKLWFPCTYFSLNPTFLTLLGVAMKLALDLTAVMKNVKIAKLTSLIFLSTSMANFTSSLGSIDGKHVLSNVVALAILVSTVLVDVTIRFIMLNRINFYILPMILMFLSLVTLVSLAAAAPAMKQSLEAAYREKYRVTLNEDQEGMLRNEGLGIDERKRFMMKYWVMAATSNPEFVMARSVICTMSALLNLISLITLSIAYVVQWRRYKGPFINLDSVYGGSVRWILYTQIVGVVVATIAPLSRWLVVVSFKQATANLARMMDEMKVEDYWFQPLVDLRGRFSSLKILGRGKFLYDVKWYVVTFFIGVQISIMLLSKLFVLISSFLMGPLFCCWERFFTNESESNKGPSFSSYAVLLPGEAELPATVVRNICKEAENMIKKGRTKQPKRLASFISKSVCFKGLGLFDNIQIPPLHSQEPPNCWSLPVVTLASIALAIPHIPEEKRENLLHSVKEGLDLTKLVEKTLLKNDRDLNNTREAADMCWGLVLLYKKWFDVDIKKMSLECKDSSEMLRELSGKAKTMVVEFLTSSSTKNPLDWPGRVIAANSMYRICQSVMLFADEDDEGVFERVCVMMSDVMAACFTNLGNVMNVMCRGSEIEKREKSVGKAFKILGKTEEIVEAVQRLEWPAMDHERAVKIEEWQAWFRQTGKVAVGIVETLVCSRDEQLAIQVDMITSNSTFPLQLP